MKFFSELTEKPIGAIIFLDIDGTLCGNGGRRPEPAALRMVKRLAQNNEIYLCSNGRNFERNRKMAELCGVRYVETELKKPSKHIVWLVHNPKKKPLVVIGNLFYTDARFAKNIGARFIRVKTLLAPKEPWVNHVFYWFDENIIARFV